MVDRRRRPVVRRSRGVVVGDCRELHEDRLARVAEPKERVIGDLAAERDADVGGVRGGEVTGTTTAVVPGEVARAVHVHDECRTDVGDEVTQRRGLGLRHGVTVPVQVDPVGVGPGVIGVPVGVERGDQPHRGARPAVLADCFGDELGGALVAVDLSDDDDDVAAVAVLLGVDRAALHAGADLRQRLRAAVEARKTFVAGPGRVRPKDDRRRSWDGRALSGWPLHQEGQEAETKQAVGSQRCGSWPVRRSGSGGREDHADGRVGRRRPHDLPPRHNDPSSMSTENIDP